MSDFDAWLEAPYTNAARREAEFEQWCEATGTDPEAEGAWEAFDAALAAEADRHEAELDAAAEAMYAEEQDRLREEQAAADDVGPCGPGDTRRLLS